MKAGAAAPGSRALERFLETLAIERGRARHTIDAYRRDLERLAEWLATAERGEQALDLRFVEHGRQVAAPPREEQVGRRIVGAVFLTVEEVVEAADRDQSAALGGGREAGATQTLQVLGER